MSADWEIDSQGVFVDISSRESQEGFVDTSRRDLLNISTTEESSDTQEHSWHFSVDVTTETAAKEEAGISDGSIGCFEQSAKNKIWYFPTDEVAHTYEVSQDYMFHSEDMAAHNSQDKTHENGVFVAKMQGGVNDENGVFVAEMHGDVNDETAEDTMTSLDNLAVLLGEPPRKKSVWEYFNLIAKNRPLAEYIEEREIRKRGVRKEPVFPGHISRPNSKRKSQKKHKCDSPIKDAPKMVKSISRRKNVIKKPNVVKQLFYADKREASSVQNSSSVSQNYYPNNNIGDDFTPSDPSSSRCITATHSTEAKNFKPVEFSNGFRFTVVNPPLNQKTTVIQPALIASSKVASVKTVGSNFEIAQFPAAIAPSNSLSTESIGSHYQNVGLSTSTESLIRAGGSGISMQGEEPPIVVINCCENCDFETSQLELLNNHQRYCYRENTY